MSEFAQNIQTKLKAPFHDYKNQEIFEGDLIQHPSGEKGTVVFEKRSEEDSDNWLVLYEDGIKSRLCLQVGDKGRAIVTEKLVGEVIRSEFEGLPFVALMLDDNFIFVEQSNEYTHKNHTEHRVTLGYLNGAWLTYQHQQSKLNELQILYTQQGVNMLKMQKQLDLLQATLESERLDIKAGFKVLFKARDMSGEWHGYSKKPEYYEKGGYWMNGGNSIYLQGSEWCDEETASNSLVAVK